MRKSCSLVAVLDVHLSLCSEASRESIELRAAFLIKYYKLAIYYDRRQEFERLADLRKAWPEVGARAEREGAHSRLGFVQRAL